MGTFRTKAILNNASQFLPQIAHDIAENFQNDGYQVQSDELVSGGYDISITKGGIFKAVLGMKTALKVTLLPVDGNVSFEAGVGIWGQQAIPTVISMLLFWPVILTQIWGMVQQSQLDDRALQIARQTVSAYSSVNSATSETDNNTKFCTNCGAKNKATAKFCSECGHPL